MLSFRQKQINEILDEDQSINRRVFGIEKEQVKTMSEAVKPKSERDIDAEYKTERSIEDVRAVLDNKVSSLDTVIGLFKPNLSRIEISSIDKNIAEISRNADFIRVYNDIVRQLLRPDVRKDIKDTLKIKMVEIQPQINALVYGIKEELIPQLLEYPPVPDINPDTPVQSILVKLQSLVPPLTSSLAIYTEVQKQLFTNSFVVLDKGVIDQRFNQILKEYRNAGMPNPPADTADYYDIIGDRQKFNLIMLGYRDSFNEAVNTYSNLNRRIFDEERREQGFNVSIPNRNELRRQLRLQYPLMSEEDLDEKVEQRLEQLGIRRMEYNINRIAPEVGAPVDDATERALREGAVTPEGEVAFRPVTPPLDTPAEPQELERSFRERERRERFETEDLPEPGITRPLPPLDVMLNIPRPRPSARRRAERRGDIFEEPDPERRRLETITEAERELMRRDPTYAPRLEEGEPSGRGRPKKQVSRLLKPMRPAMLFNSNRNEMYSR